MGFYGNITNIAKSTFQFDKIYSSRVEMEANKTKDHIYAGRYVLINYEISPMNTTYSDTTYLYKDIDGELKLYTDLETCNINMSVIPPISVAEEDYQTGGVSIPEDWGSHLNLKFIGPNENARVFFNTLPEGAIFKLAPGMRIFNLNSSPKYVKITINALNKDGEDIISYRIVSEQDYLDFVHDGQWPNMDQEGFNIDNPDNLKHAHVVNGIVSLQTAENLANGDWFIIPPRYSYDTNMEQEYWVYSAKDFTLKSFTGETSYQTNYNLDFSTFNAGRGYDSTVWQKVYVDGAEKYVMIAELNSVVPTFDVSADAPTLTPITPHFDAASTNVYYKLHWQPQWGFRIKAANGALTTSLINKHGIETGTNGVVKLRQDGLSFPSDENITWRTTIYDANADTRTDYIYDPSISGWSQTESDNNLIPAAIYYNKHGFDKINISYSKDLTTSYPDWHANEDKITITPSGQSGMVYNIHNNIASMEPQIDTQELSIMLPSLGDSVAHMWDLIYGNRETTPSIAQTNLRNDDISWEDAGSVLHRNGLRLVSNGSGIRYTPKQVETLAGCINSVHDILGMIITEFDPSAMGDFTEYIDEYDSKTGKFALQSDTAASVFDFNKIYFNNKNGQYYRLHKTYKYTPITDETIENIGGQDQNIYIYKPTNFQIANENMFEANIYFVKDENTNTYKKASIFTPNTIYYERQLNPQATYMMVPTDFSPFDGQNMLAQEYTGNPAVTPSQPLRLDYLTSEYYQPNKHYYTVIPNNKTYHFTSTNASYIPNHYYQLINGQYLLDQNETPYLKGNYPYVVIDELQVTEYKEALGYINSQGKLKFYDGIYVPGIYYYLDDNGKYSLDTNKNMTKGRKYYKLKISKDNYYSLKEEKEQVYLTADTYIPGSYWIIDSEKPNTYIISYGNYDPTQTYFKITSYYEKNDSTDTDHLSIDIDTEHSLALHPFTDNTFYSKLFDKNLRPIGYKVETMESIAEKMKGWYNNDVLDIDYYVFGYDKNEIEYNSNKLINPITKLPYDTAISTQDTFYEANRYHYKVTTGPYKDSYVLDTNDLPNFGAADETENFLTYYTLQNVEPINALFYEPYKYYIQTINGEYKLATEETFNPDIQYYTKHIYYVMQDDALRIPIGAEWNLDATFVPANIVLGIRTDSYELLPLDGFARNLNTIHGLILKLNQLLEMNDIYTRDLTTVQGTINSLKDLMAKFEKLKSRGILIVDNYGRVKTAEFITSQSNSATLQKPNKSSTPAIDKPIYEEGVAEDIYPQAENLESMEKQWITLNVDGNTTNPLITIHHNFQSVEDTHTISDKNIALTKEYNDDVDRIKPINTAEKYDNNEDDNDILKLYTPIIDNMGHVVGSNTEEVTLPYGFKAIQAVNKENNSDEKWFQDNNAAASIGESTNIIYADNTKDTLQLSGNKWIRFKTTGTGIDTNSVGTKLSSAKELIIAHETHTPTITAQYSNLNKELFDINDKVQVIDTATDMISSMEGDNLTIQDIKFDNAGHMTHNQPHTYTLPSGFKYMTTNGLTDTSSEDLYTTINSNVNGADKDEVRNPQNSELAASAKNTQDSLQITTKNKWIQTQLLQSTDNSNNTLILAHEIHAIPTDAAAAINLNDLVELEDKTKTVQNTINIQSIEFDKAGHAITNRPQTYTLPFGFKTIQIAKDTSAGTGDAANTIINAWSAKNTQDTLTFKASNQWLKLDNSVEGQIQIGHTVNSITKNDKQPTDLNNVQNQEIGTITVHDLAFDDAGHVTSNQLHQYTLPFGYKYFSDNEMGDEKGISTATSCFSTFTFKGDEWIKPKVTSGMLSLTHEDPIKTTGWTGSTNATLNFGESFTLNDFDFDNKGHKANASTYTITLPAGSLTRLDASNNNTLSTDTNLGVLTAISFINSTGAITTKENYLGNIALGVDSKFTDANNPNTASNLSSTTTLSQALQLLDQRIFNEEKARASIPSVSLNTDSSSITVGENSLSNIITTDSTFAYEESIDIDAESQPQSRDLTIEDLVAKVQKLEEIISVLMKN